MFLYSIVISTIYIDIDIVKNILLYYSVYFASLYIDLLQLTLALPVSALCFDFLLFTLFADLHYFVSLYISFAALLYFILLYCTLIYTLHFIVLFLPFLYSESTRISFISLSYFSKDLVHFCKHFTCQWSVTLTIWGSKRTFSLISVRGIQGKTNTFTEFKRQAVFSGLSRELLRKIKKLRLHRKRILKKKMYIFNDKCY